MWTSAANRRYTTVNMTETSLKGKVAIVTGASAGIGAAISIVLAKAGVKLSLAARREDKLAEVKSAIENDGGVAICVKTDVTSREQMKELVRQTELQLGPVDILVNNAGVYYLTLMKNLHEEEWDRTIDVNCRGVVNGVGAVIDGMVSRGKGHIINMSSTAGRKGYAGMALYCASKYFVEGLSRCLRKEVCRSGVRVTTIQPGDVGNTEIFDWSTDQEAIDMYKMDCKLLEPQDIAKAVLDVVSAPAHVAVNEVLIEPTEDPTAF